MKTKKSTKRATKVKVIEKLAQKNLTGGAGKIAMNGGLDIVVAHDCNC